MTDFIEGIPQPRRRIVNGERPITGALNLHVSPCDSATARMSVRSVRGSYYLSDKSDFPYSAPALRNLIAALTEVAEVLEQEN